MNDESDLAPPHPPRHRPAPDRPPLPNPRRVGTFGMFLFLAALGMLFAASILGYILIRLRIANPTLDPATGDPVRPAMELGAIDIPLILWLSTALMVVSSITLHWAGLSVVIERQRNFRRGMTLTFVLGLLFLIVQGPALAELVQRQAVTDNVRLYYLALVLIVLHGLHVIGGLIPLGVLVRNAFLGKYDHEHSHPVTLFAMYWHFLLIVWIVMFMAMQWLG